MSVYRAFQTLSFYTKNTWMQFGFDLLVGIILKPLLQKLSKKFRKGFSWDFTVFVCDIVIFHVPLSILFGHYLRFFYVV